MTPKYWAGIFAVMLAIFGVGMLVARGVNKGRAFVENNFPAYLGLINADFRVNGHRVGDIQRLQFMRSTPGLVDSAVLTVKLGDNTDAIDGADCKLRVINAQPFNSDTRFSCTNEADAQRLRLAPFGHIVMLGDSGVADRTVTLYVSGDRASDVQLHAYRGTGSHDSGDVDIKTTDGNLSVTVNGQEIVRASGDSAGGSLVIRDEQGHAIVQISGSEKGGSIRVTDANGNTRLNLHGSSSKPAKKDSTKEH